jgi:hypothetical protein
VERFDLVEVVESIRAELSEAARRGEGADIQLPVEGVELQFQVDVTRAREKNGKLTFWVLELGIGDRSEQSSGHIVTVKLGPPVDAQGRTLNIARRTVEKP